MHYYPGEPIANHEIVRHRYGDPPLKKSDIAGDFMRRLCGMFCNPRSKIVRTRDEMMVEKKDKNQKKNRIGPATARSRSKSPVSGKRHENQSNSFYQLPHHRYRCIGWRARSLCDLLRSVPAKSGMALSSSPISIPATRACSPRSFSG